MLTPAGTARTRAKHASASHGCQLTWDALCWCARRCAG